jgi:DNA topoisomerase-2
MEVDALIKLSKEDIWTKDLDEFLAEWRFQLEDEDRRQRKVASLGRRASSKLKTAVRGPLSKKRKAAGDDPDDSDFAAPKTKKKAATVKHVQPKGGLLDYLSKASPKPKQQKYSMGIDGASDSDFEEEILPQKKSRAMPTKPVKDTAVDRLGDFDSQHNKPESATQKPAEAADNDGDSDLEVISKPPPRQARANRKPIAYASSSESDSDNGEDLLADVSKMVKGIGQTGGDSVLESRTLFSELSRPGSSAGLKTTSKINKMPTDFDADETDYSKLVPQQSPRRSLQVKPKDTKLSDDDVPSFKPAISKPPASKAKAPAPKATAKPGRKPSKAASNASQTKEKKTTVKESSATVKNLKPSPAAKAYASKQAKVDKKLIDELSDDDIDAMANDILDSPPGRGLNKKKSGPLADVSVLQDSAASRARPSRRAATTAKQFSYRIDGDSDEDMFDKSDSASHDDFSDID